MRYAPALLLVAGCAQAAPPQVTGPIEPDSVAIVPSVIEVDPETNLGYGWLVYYHQGRPYVCAALDGMWGWASVMVMGERLVWPRAAVFIARGEPCDVSLYPHPPGYNSRWLGEVEILRDEEAGRDIPPGIEVRRLRPASLGVVGT